MKFLLIYAIFRLISPLLATSSLSKTLPLALDPIESDENLSVISCIGSKGTGKGALLAEIFGKKLDSRDVDVSNGVVCIKTHEKGETVASMAISDAVIYNLLVSDISRSIEEVGNNFQSLFEPYINSLDAKEQKVEEIRKKKVLVAIRDYDDLEFSRSEVEDALLKEMERVWERIVKKGIFYDKSVSDVFSFQFYFLPNSKLSNEGFRKSAEEIKSEVLGEISSDSVQSILSKFGKVASLFGDNFSQIFPSLKEMSSVPTAKIAQSQSVSLFKNRLASIASSILNDLDEEFGPRIDMIIDEALENFDQATEKFSGTSAVSKIYSELKSSLLKDAQSIYSLQIQFLKAAAGEKFRRNPTTLRVSPTLSRDLNAAIDECEEYMAKTSKGMQSKYLKSMVDFERKQLRAELKELSKERLQLARIQGGAAALSRPRKQIGMSFHWLLPEPFGNDARQTPLELSDEAAYCSERLKADNLFFEFSPVDKLPAPKGGEKVVSPEWEAIKSNAEKMVFKRSQMG
mmetsp:Transcript_12329/g.18477  ORF Transcript_12329/g.18477 Transcript_12329/m.18477 type:complete len:516 (+) Transcript_12329:51-1598(+)